MRWRTLPPASADAGATLLADGFGDDRFPARSVRVHLPPGYEAAAGPYPVLYMHDGQSAYDAASTGARATWGADRAADALVSEGLAAVIVAVDSGPDRIAEYSPWHEPRLGAGGHGAAYVDFVRRRVKPVIEREFAVRRDPPGVGTAGSSLGGLLSLFTTLRHPTEFGFCAALSPAIWYGSRAIVGIARGRDRAGLRCYLDIGTRESEAEADNRTDIENVRLMATVLREQGADIVLAIEPGAAHTEDAWRRRFPAALAWFLDPSRRPGQPRGVDQLL
jgi:predicted alpha/beta superfamily hydrolase